MGSNSYFDLGGGLQAFQKGYQAKKELEQRQQQIDYSSPKELSMSPGMLSQIGMGPLGQMREAYIIGQGLAGEPAKRPVINEKGQQVYPKQSGFDYTPQSPQAPYLEDATRMPAGEQQQGGGVQMGPGGLPIEFYDGRAAAQFGLKQDPETGRVFGPGRQVKEFYDMVDKIVGSQAAILSGAGRPQVQPAPIVIGDRAPRAPSRPASPRKTPFEESLIKEKDQLLKSLSGIQGAMIGKSAKEEIKSRIKQIDDTLSGGSSRFMQQAPSPQQAPQAAAPVNGNAGGSAISLQDAKTKAAQGQGRILQRKNGTQVFRDAQGNQVDVK